MEEEFKNWPGGWEVMKHKPFLQCKGAWIVLFTFGFYMYDRCVSFIGIIISQAA